MVVLSVGCWSQQPQPTDDERDDHPPRRAARDSLPVPLSPPLSSYTTSGDTNEQNLKIAQLEAELARRPAPGAADVAAEALQAALARAQEAEEENRRLQIDLLLRHKVSLNKRKKVADLVRERLGTNT